MKECCYNCKFLNMKKFEYHKEEIKDGFNTLPYKDYHCEKKECCRVYVDCEDGSNVNKQSSAKSQLSYMSCNKFEEKER